MRVCQAVGLGGEESRGNVVIVHLTEQAPDSKNSSEHHQHSFVEDRTAIWQWWLCSVPLDKECMEKLQSGKEAPKWYWSNQNRNIWKLVIILGEISDCVHRTGFSRPCQRHHSLLYACHWSRRAELCFHIKVTMWVPHRSHQKCTKTTPRPYWPQCKINLSTNISHSRHCIGFWSKYMFSHL